MVNNGSADLRDTLEPGLWRRLLRARALDAFIRVPARLGSHGRVSQGVSGSVLVRAVASGSQCGFGVKLVSAGSALS